MNGVFSKLAAKESFLSARFCAFYGGIVLILGIYAVAWQQIIKRIPLTTAFANKAVTVVWGLVWGALVFREPITPGKIIGVLLIVAGVVLFSSEEREEAGR
jgi:Membrane transporters of cations and cationic drugs